MQFGALRTRNQLMAKLRVDSASPATELVDGVPVNQFIDQFGEETEDPTGFDGLPAWSPIISIRAN